VREEWGGGARGCEVSRRSVRGYQAAVCVHVGTLGGCFGGDEAEFALQTRVVSAIAGSIEAVSYGSWEKAQVGAREREREEKKEN
jgi:hypothetical protein